VRRRVVITGLGVITAVGAGKEAFWDAIRAGRSGIRPLTRFDGSALRSRIAGEVGDFDPQAHFPARRLKRLDRFAQFSLVAAKLALEDAAGESSAGEPPVELTRRLFGGSAPRAWVGVCTGSALGGVSLAEHQHELFLRDGLRTVNPSLAFLVFGGSGSSHIAIEFGLSGPGHANSNSCASGAIALGEAYRIVRDGRAAGMIAGAAEAPLAPLSFGAFDLLRAMSARNDTPERACRPFDAGRDGFVMGEGAAMFLLEDLEHAQARGARVYAEILGYACNNDAHHMLAPRPDGSCAAHCMQAALDAAGASPGRVGYINAHATGTPLGDAAETRAIRTVFGGRARELPVSSTKPFHAHPLGASGAIEVAVCCLALEREFLPPTLNLEARDADCELAHVLAPGRAARVDCILSNSFGFGGINACLVLGRYEAV
jgi:3-oxoacyl-[acyl-carrier-protein] synthase II